MEYCACTLHVFNLGPKACPRVKDQKLPLSCSFVLCHVPLSCSFVMLFLCQRSKAAFALCDHSTFHGCAACPADPFCGACTCPQHRHPPVRWVLCCLVLAVYLWMYAGWIYLLSLMCIWMDAGWVDIPLDGWTP